jgi:U6 snRNA-associated Sm-like protein LSm6
LFANSSRCLTFSHSGIIYRGILVALDGYLNVALEQTEEFMGGELKNRYNDAFLRGNNILYISAE